MYAIAEMERNYTNGKKNKTNLNTSASCDVPTEISPSET